MKIYDWHIAPNPRRLQIYSAEKGIEVELVEVGQKDLTLAPYFEEIQPEPPLMGACAKEKAIVAMWEKRASEEDMLPASELFRNTHPAFADRGLPGSGASSASSTSSSPRASS